MNERTITSVDYRKPEVISVGLGHAVLVLYDGAIEFASEARSHLIAGELRKALTCRGKLLNVLSALLSSLRFDADLVQANGFWLIYDHLSRLARKAEIERGDSSSFDEVLRIMGQLRASWSSALSQQATA